jgi:hypothetical protein
VAATRNRKEEKIYRAYRSTLQPGYCQFCDLPADEPGILNATKHFIVLKNTFAYSLWEHMDVQEHLLLLPKRHIATLRELTTPEKIEYAELCGQYEDSGYSLYTRATDSKTKSVVHQHTHLIKNQGEPRRIVFYSRHPTIRMTL